MKIKIFVAAFLLFLCDQISKVLVMGFVPLSSSIPIIDGFFSIRYIQNTGAAWGMFSNSTIILALISVIFLFFMIKYVNGLSSIKKLEGFAYSMIIAGIMGNLFDRLIRGYVVDFFEFIIFNYNFPIFNVADILIVVGAFLAFIVIWIGGVKDDSNKG